MISKKYSHNFRQMFFKSVRQTILLPILMLATGLFYSFINFMSMSNNSILERSDKTPFFFDDLRTGLGFLNFFVVVFAAITAISLFKFQWSKKESNVIFSLGMKRSEIFNAKILAGIVPVAVVAILVSVAEIASNILLGKTFNAVFWEVAIFMIVSWLAVYIFSFVICAVVFSCSGNVVEACFYTLFIAFLPTVVYCILRYMQYGYVLGYSFDAPLNVRFDLPFIQHYVYINSGDTLNYYQSFYNLANSKPKDFSDYSSMVFALIYSAVAYVLGLLEFKKHKVEIAGTWGRSKVMTGLCSIIAGLSCFLLMNELCSDGIQTTSGILNFVLCCIAFLVGVILFKLIFTIRRKKEIKKSLKQYPICVATLGLVSLIFVFGFFGYSSYIPDSDQIQTVSVEMGLYNYRENNIYGSSGYALLTPEIESELTNIFRGQLRGKYFNADTDYYDYSYPTDDYTVDFIGQEDIDQVVNVHKALVADGKISKRSDNANFLPITIKYTLKDNRIVYRHYYTTTSETAKKILALSDTKSAKKKLKTILDAQNSNNQNELEEALGTFLGKDIKINGYKVYEYNNDDPIGELYEGMQTTFVYHDYLSGEEYKIPDELIYGYYKSSMLSMNECYLFGKDMANGHKIGFADYEIIDALKADMLSQTSSNYYNHTFEDELGIISFGACDTNYMNINDDSLFDSEDDSLIPWRIFASDATTFVVTKSMTNTLKYLKSNDLLKYFENTKKVSDIKSIKLATPVELYGEKRKCVYPIFCAGYCVAESVELEDNSYVDIDREDWIENNHSFVKIDNQITDIDKIQKLMSSSLLFGYCENDSRIMEIEYKDGSIGTRMISAEVYNSIK